MSVFVAVEWLEMICAGWMEVGKMAACRLSTTPVRSFLGFFPAATGFSSCGSQLGCVEAIQTLIWWARRLLKMDL